MMRRIVLTLFLLAMFRVQAAELSLDVSGSKPGEFPSGWTNLLAGTGKPGSWEVRLESVPSSLEPLSAQAVNLNRRAVVVQTVPSAEDERFPLLLWNGQKFGDFTYKARIQIVGGALEQIAGLVFRAQDEKNFYVVRLSALGGNLRFYKFVDGQRSPPIGPSMPFEKGRWYELAVRASGNQLDVLLDGTNAFPTITDNTFLSGRIGFITKSDTLAQFADPHLSYRPMETLATALVRETLANQPRLLGLRLFGTSAQRSELHCLASKDPTEIGLVAGETERKVYAENRTYFGKKPEAAIVTAALHDRNGEVIGVMEFRLKPFPGQVESTTVARVLPTIRKLEGSIGGARDLTE